MPFNGSGVFTRVYSWVADKAAGLDISSSRMDTDSNDIASNGFGNCLTRDGQGVATSNLPMATFRHTNVGNGVARTDYAALGQLQDGTPNWIAAAGSADALTATYSPAVTALADGQLLFVRAAHANATTTPTLAVNGLTAHTITKQGGNALVASDIPGNLAECIFRYNLANTRFELLNPASVSGASSSSANNLALFADSTGHNLSDSGLAVGAVTETVVGMIIDGEGSVITAGAYGQIPIPCGMTITSWGVIADQSGSIVVDVRRANNAVPTSSIVGSGNKPTLSSQQINNGVAPSSWTATTLARNDFVDFNVTGTPSSVQRVGVYLFCTKTGA